MILQHLNEIRCNTKDTLEARLRYHTNTINTIKALLSLL